MLDYHSIYLQRQNWKFIFRTGRLFQVIEQLHSNCTELYVKTEKYGKIVEPCLFEAFANVTKLCKESTEHAV